jgi:hypothetical protein
VRHFSDYARRRMQERGVLEDDVYSALANRVGPERSGRIPGSTVVRGLDTRGTLLDVIVSDLGEILNAFHVK